MSESRTVGPATVNPDGTRVVPKGSFHGGAG